MPQDYIYSTETAVDFMKSALSTLGQVSDFPLIDDHVPGVMVPVQQSRVWGWAIQDPLFQAIGTSVSNTTVDGNHPLADYMINYQNYEQLVANGLNLPSFVGVIGSDLAQLLMPNTATTGAAYVWNIPFLQGSGAGQVLYDMLYRVALIKVLTESPYMMSQYSAMIAFNAQQEQARAAAVTASAATIANMTAANKQQIQNLQASADAQFQQNLQEAHDQLAAAQASLVDTVTKLNSLEHFSAARPHMVKSGAPADPADANNILVVPCLRQIAEDVRRNIDNLNTGGAWSLLR